MTHNKCFKFVMNTDGSTDYVRAANCNCELPKCPKCKKEEPQDLLDCHEGYCMECAMEIFDVFGDVKEKLGIYELKGKKYLQKFADLMAEFYNYEN